jgi:NitT/TauT family transport system permease protein
MAEPPGDNNRNNPEETGMSVSRRRALASVLVSLIAVALLAAPVASAIKWIERKAAIWQTGTRGGQQAAEEIAAVALQPAT